jgi:hypothetical protein
MQASPSTAQSSFFWVPIPWRSTPPFARASTPAQSPAHLRPPISQSTCPTRDRKWSSFFLPGLRHIFISRTSVSAYGSMHVPEKGQEMVLEILESQRCSGKRLGFTVRVYSALQWHGMVKYARALTFENFCRWLWCV